MGKAKMNTMIRILATASCLAFWSGLVQGAQYTIPISLLYYTPGATSNYVFPRSGVANSALCSENKPYANQYLLNGKSQGIHSHTLNIRIGQPAVVTLYESKGKGTAQLKISPLGVRKTASLGWVGPLKSSDTCASLNLSWDFFVEKSINSNSTLEETPYLNTNPTFYYTLAFELLDANNVPPGIYYTRGGYQFKSSELAMSQGTTQSSMVSPYIPTLSLVVGHVFKIDMPYTSVSLMQSYGNDDIFTGKVRFRAQSNERYSITMTCSSPSSATSGGDCNFAGTQMELATQARFPKQGRTFDLRHNIPTYIDGADFTDSLYEYPGYIDFTLSGVSQHGETGKTYFDTVNLTFEADF
ncbi:hypothetical protein C9J01_24090 [Photobacterium rosenbergii]|uniref:Fimbrial protein n=1 Tax=Photobacterium rosenbergii TaxID=294936 RepID=A0A2T3N6A2_9GAMM|nr:hypothetical protein [Photobacterium rosenbergii]PSW08254.1 hypothetical protein C9J01_24090 [Photobacterium rosenbergii]